MKAQSTGNNKGFSTLEVLIAFTVLILCVTAVILVVFGNQSVTVDTQTNVEAISKAQKELENVRALSRQDFVSVVSDPAPVSDGIYNKQNTIVDLTQCLKQATSLVSWNIESRALNVNFSTFLSDIGGVIMMGSDCDSEISGDWDNPITATSVGIGGQGATDIDVCNDFVYLTSDPSAASKEDFFIYEFDSVAVSLTERAKIHVSAGLNGVDVINDYAFTINSEASGHLIVFNISDPSNPTLIASNSLPDMIVGVARSIFYYNHFIYIGTQYLGCPVCPSSQNNEFHIFNVSVPGAPVWRGSFKVNHNINDIAVRGDYAYLATSDNNGELRIYNISDPSAVSFEGLFNAPGNEDGDSLYLLGNKLYLGRDRTPAARKDFYVLNISDPTSPTELGSKNLGLNPGATVEGIVVRGSLAFVGVDNPISGIQILTISDPSNIVNHPICTSLNFSENSTAIDMEGDTVFSANNSNDEIRVIRDQASTC